MTRRTHRVRSTGAEPTPDAPVTTHAPVGAPVATSAELFDDEPVTTRMSYLDEPITVHSPTPGPFTMTIGWLADAETKVIEPAEQAGPEPARTQAHTKTSRSRGRTGNR